MLKPLRLISRLRNWMLKAERGKSEGVTHYVALLEKKDREASEELERLERMLKVLHKSYLDVEAQIQNVRKVQNIRADVARHLSTHHHFT